MVLSFFLGFDLVLFLPEEGKGGVVDGGYEFDEEIGDEVEVPIAAFSAALHIINSESIVKVHTKTTSLEC